MGEQQLLANSTAAVAQFGCEDRKQGPSYPSCVRRPTSNHDKLLKVSRLGTAEPFIRWAGAKRRHLPTLLSLTPARYNTYFEPFLGSGALFLALQPRQAVLNDRIVDLIRTWRAIQKHPEEVATQAKTWPVAAETFYEVRAMSPETAIEAAARFIYLNKTCFNGLYRVNSRGKFNVPFGRPKTDNIVSEANLVAISKLLTRKTKLLCGDFEVAVSTAKPRDLVYFDPPYVVGHANNGFVEYNETLFSWSDQERLAKLARRLAERGVHVIVSNAMHDQVADLYPDFSVVEVSNYSSMAGRPDKRLRVTEAIFYSLPAMHINSTR